MIYYEKTFVIFYFEKSFQYLCIMQNEKIEDLVQKGVMLPLMEEFYTIQGEGYHTGTAAYLSE